MKNNLIEWHQLYKQGIINQEEFENKKRQILGIPSNFKTDDHLNSNSLNSSKLPISNFTKSIFIVLSIATCIASFYWFNNRYNDDEKIQNSTQKDTATPFPKNEDTKSLSNLSNPLSQERIINDLITYSIANFEIEREKKGSELFDDKKYITSFFSTNEKSEEDDSVEIQFFAKYKNYTNKWLQDNKWKLNQCMSSFTFQLDKNKLTEMNQYLKTEISTYDFDNNGMPDYLVTGYHNNCSGGSGGEGKYFITYTNDIITDILIELPLHYSLKNNKIIIYGENKSTTILREYKFNQKTFKWDTDSEIITQHSL